MLSLDSGRTTNPLSCNKSPLIDCDDVTVKTSMNFFPTSFNNNIHII
jgi:hypothetical protein